MRSITLHVIAYGLTYLLTGGLVLGVVGIYNRCIRKPFFEGWKNGLFFITVWTVGGWLIDLVPHRTQLILAFPIGIVLITSLIWLFKKHPGPKNNGGVTEPPTK